MNDAALDQFWGLSEASLRWVGGLLLEMLPRTLVFGLVGFVAAFGLVVFAHRRGWFVRRHRVWNILCKLHVPLWIVLFSVFGCALGAARSVESRVAVELDESFGPLLAAQLPTLKTFLLEELPVRSADDPISVGEATQRFLHKLYYAPSSDGWIDRSVARCVNWVTLNFGKWVVVTPSVRSLAMSSDAAAKPCTSTTRPSSLQ